MPVPKISKLTFGRYSSSFGVGEATPSLSWRVEQDENTDQNWQQTQYELVFVRAGKQSHHRVDTGNNVEESWPNNEPGLKFREKIEVRVKAGGDWFSQTFEAALLDSADWKASVIAPDIAPPVNLAIRPFYARKTIKVDSAKSPRIYATALSVYEISINGKVVGDHVILPPHQCIPLYDTILFFR
jgi:alpha-L-rhamnosidase